MFIKRFSALSKWGVVYWSPGIYRTVMALLRGKKGRRAMYEKIGQEIGGRSVLELCCGAGDLIPWVRGAYQGIDRNPAFVDALKRRGVQVVQGDALGVEWPPAECLVIVDSLYHFMAHMDLFMQRVKAHPSKTVIISEPVENVIPKLQGVLKGLGNWMTRVEGQSHPQRFTETSLRDFFERQGFQKVSRVDVNCIGVLDKHG